MCIRKKDRSQSLRQKIRTEVPLSRYTTFRIGGPAERFCTIRSIGFLIDLVREALTNGERFLILGSGSNILFSDAGFRGLVIRNRCSAFGIKGNLIVAQSGALLSRLVEASCDHGLVGMESLAGIPGTLGGAIYGNAGAFGDSIARIVYEATVLDRQGRIKTVDPSYFRFGYRTSFLKTSGDVLLGASIRLEPGVREVIAQRIEEIKRERAARHPWGIPCAGSFFKNLPDQTQDSRRIPAGKLLEEIGAKEMRVGGASIYPGHANFIVNTGGATAAQVMELARILKSRVRERFGLELEEEVIIVDPYHSLPE